MLLKKIKNSPASYPFLLFGVGIVFFVIAEFNQTPIGTVNEAVIFALMFFGFGVIVGIYQIITKKRKK